MRREIARKQSPDHWTTSHRCHLSICARYCTVVMCLIKYLLHHPCHHHHHHHHHILLSEIGSMIVISSIPHTSIHVNNVFIPLCIHYLSIHLFIDVYFSSIFLSIHTSLIYLSIYSFIPDLSIFPPQIRRYLCRPRSIRMRQDSHLSVPR